MVILVTIAGFGATSQWLAWCTRLHAAGNTPAHDAPERPAAKPERIRVAAES